MKNTAVDKKNAPEAALKDPDFNRVSELEKSFKFFKKINDPRFGEITIIQNPQSREFLAVRERKINDRAEAGRAIISTRIRQSLQNPYLLSLKDYSVKKESQLCSSFYILKLFFEYPRSDLRREMQDRQRSGQPFSDAELTHILYQQLTAMGYLQGQGQIIGDLQPLNISWDRDTQTSKLIDKLDETNSVVRAKEIQKNRLIAGHPIYQSPTMYANLKKNNLNFNFDPAKEEAFALGLLLLEAGNGQSIQNIYDSKKGTVDQVALQQHVTNFQNRYGQDNSLLSSVVTNLATFDEASRQTPNNILTSIKPYSEIKSYLQTRNSMAVPDIVTQTTTVTREVNAQAQPQTDVNLFDFNDSNPWAQPAIEEKNPYLTQVEASNPSAYGTNDLKYQSAYSNNFKAEDAALAGVGAVGTGFIVNKAIDSNNYQNTQPASFDAWSNVQPIVKPSFDNSKAVNVNATPDYNLNQFDGKETYESRQFVHDQKKVEASIPGDSHNSTWNQTQTLTYPAYEAHQTSYNVYGGMEYPNQQVTNKSFDYSQYSAPQVYNTTYVNQAPFQNYNTTHKSYSGVPVVYSVNESAQHYSTGTPYIQQEGYIVNSGRPVSQSIRQEIVTRSEPVQQVYAGAPVEVKQQTASYRSMPSNTLTTVGYTPYSNYIQTAGVVSGNSYSNAPTVKHEFILDDSRVVEPEIIRDKSIISGSQQQVLIRKSLSSHVSAPYEINTSVPSVYTSTPQTNYKSTNIIYSSNAPVTYTSVAPATATYTTGTPVKTEYFSNAIPSGGVLQRGASFVRPVSGQGSNVYTTRVSKVETQPYTVYESKTGTSNQVIYTAGSNELKASTAPKTTIRSSFRTLSATPSELEGLKFIGTYTEPRHG